MAISLPLTIRDYLEARHQDGLRVPGRRISPGPVQPNGRFSRLLEIETAADGSLTSRGLTAADYRAAAVPSCPADSPVPKAALLQQQAAAIKPKDAAPAARSATGTATVEAATVETAASSEIHPVSRVNAHPKARPVPGGADHRERIHGSVLKAAGRYNLPPELIKGVIRAESNFKADAVSPAGAQGLMQLMPATARELGVTDPFDVDQNIDGGSRYLRQMLDRYGGNLRVALAAYNAGPGNVDKYGGEVPFPETRQYIGRVLTYAGGVA